MTARKSACYWRPGPLHLFALAIRVALAMTLVTDLAAAPSISIDGIEGYVVRLRVGNGAVTLMRHGSSFSVSPKMALLVGDEITVSGDAALELQTAKRRLVLNAARPSYRIEASSASPPPSALIEAMSESFHKLLEKAPSGVAHSESKGGVDCAQEVSAESPGIVDFRPVGSLVSQTQVLPQNLRAVTVAWLGGQPPYHLYAAEANKVSPSNIGDYCATSVDNVDLGSFGNASDVDLTVVDAKGQAVKWDLHFVPESAFARLLQQPVADGDDLLSTGINALSSDNKGLHLAGATILSHLANKYFVAWRLSIAVKENEITR